MTALLVRKYGGSSLADPGKLRSVAQSLAELHLKGHPLIVVVSAMGKSTDELIRLAYTLSSRPSPRELDMLISTGERISMSLLAMALNDLGRSAISFTGSQAGILTSPSHMNATIRNIKPARVEEELRAGKIIVVAGFQGVCPETKEVTTLGRGGSDTSAVALAAHFKAQRCEVLKDVPGVHSMDPKWGYPVRHLPHLSYRQLHHMTYWGAKVLHHRSVALAQRMGVPLLVGLAHGQGASTLISPSEDSMYESVQVLAVSHKENLLSVHLPGASLSEALTQLSQTVTQRGLPEPERVHQEITSSDWKFCLHMPSEHLPEFKSSLLEAGFQVDEHLKAALTLSGNQLAQSPLLLELVKALTGQKIMIQSLLTSPDGVSLFVSQSDLTAATKVYSQIQQTSEIRTT